MSDSMNGLIASEGTRRRRRDRRGSVLVEFAMIALVTSMLLAATLSFGVILCKSNVAQEAADFAAQELARMPLNPINTINPGNDSGYLDDVLYSASSDSAVTAVRTQLFDEQYLFRPLSGGTTLYQDANNWPMLNRLLMPMMIYDPDRSDSTTQTYRYPGAVVTNNATGHTTVLVPLLIQRGTQGETIEWHRPVEEIKYPDGSGGYTGQFSLIATSTANGFTPGVVALRIYCPVQTAMISFQPPATDAEGGPAPNGTYVNQADDAAVTATDPYGLMQQYTLAPAVLSNPGTDSGEYGLGYFLSPLPTLEGSAPGAVRPYSHTAIGQGIYRREVFGP